jgi:hypothetical protein
LEPSFGYFAAVSARLPKLGAAVESVASLKRVYQDYDGDGEFGLASIPLDFLRVFVSAAFGAIRLASAPRLPSRLLYFFPEVGGVFVVSFLPETATGKFVIGGYSPMVGDTEVL